MGKKSGPKGPDVTGAAREQGRYARQQNMDTLYADRPDQYNPFGSITWNQERVRNPAGGYTNKWTQNQELSPETGAVFNPLMQSFGQRAGLMSTLTDRTMNEMSEAPDWNQFGEAQGLEYSPDELRARAEDALYQRQVSRLDPQFAERRSQLENRLRNQGLKPGDRAYDAAMATLGRTSNDAYENARLTSITGGQSEADMLFGQQMEATNMANALRDKKIQEYLGKRSFSLGEMEALNPTNDATALANLVTGGGS